MVYLEILLNLDTDFIVLILFLIGAIAVLIKYNLTPVSLLPLAILMMLLITIALIPTGFLDNNSKYLELNGSTYVAENIYEDDKKNYYYIQTKNKLIKTDKINIHKNDKFKIIRKSIKDKYFKFLDVELNELKLNGKPVDSNMGIYNSK